MARFSIVFWMKLITPPVYIIKCTVHKPVVTLCVVKVVNIVGVLTMPPPPHTHVMWVANMNGFHFQQCVLPNGHAMFCMYVTNICGYVL